MSSNKKPLADLRINYDQATLQRADLPADPYDLFAVWLDAAVQANILEPNAMTLATATPNGIPSARIVLLKGVEHGNGFRFFTNYDSQKGQELAANQHAALVFYWGDLHRQVRVTGAVEKLSTAESERYFHSRPRGSQIGAWTSPQSEPIANRAMLEARERALQAQYTEADTIPLPPNWGGFLVRPRSIEFWQGRPSRLHDRLRYQKSESGWEIERLAP